jgi:CRP-like cAMP-binding protein
MMTPWPCMRPSCTRFTLLVSAIRTQYIGQGEALFVEGETARGIYILRSGRATSSISSHEGRVVILRIALAEISSYPKDIAQLGLSRAIKTTIS